MCYRILSFFAGALLLAAGGAGASVADSAQPYPEFVATYDASANGIGIGSVTISLTREGEDRYLYKQESSGSGILSLFRSDDAIESSRWQLVDGHIQPLEYRSQRKDGDDDDNAHLLFDWQSHKVKNVGAGKHWEIALPDGALDRLVMQLAMLFDLRDGVSKFDYKVPRQVDLHEALPRMDSGKLLKRKLREPYWAGSGRAI